MTPRQARYKLRLPSPGRVRFTVRISPEVLRAVKHAALDGECTIEYAVEMLLRSALADYAKRMRDPGWGD